MNAVKIQDVKMGDFFKVKPDAKKVYTRAEFCRENKKYTGEDYEDISRCRYFKKDTIVFVDFEF